MASVSAASGGEEAPPQAAPPAAERRSAAAAPAAPRGPDYEPPDWAGKPGPPLRGSSDVALELLVRGEVKHRVPLDVESYDSFLVGRAKNCDVSLEGLEPQASRFHCILQCREGSSEIYVYDLQSSHGTLLNGRRLPPRTFEPMRVGEQLRFCADKPASCIAVLCGPDTAMAEEGEVDLEAFRAKAARDRAERERAEQEDLRRRKDAKRLRLSKEAQRQMAAKAFAARAQQQLQAQQEEEARDRQKLHEVTWGMAEDAAELPPEDMSEEAQKLMDGDGRLDLEKVRQQVKLTEKQEQMITKVEQKKRRVDNLLREKRRLEERVTANAQRMADADLDLDEPQLARGDRGATDKLEGIELKLEKAEEDLSEQMDNILLSLGFKTSRGKSERISRKRAALYDTRLEDEDDDFFDRTAASKDRREGPQADASGTDIAIELVGLPSFDDGVETRSSLEAKMEVLKAEQAHLSAQMAAEAVKERHRSGNLGANAESGQDSLDSFMGSTFAELRQDRRAKLARRLSAVDSLLKEGLVMLRVAKRNVDDQSVPASGVCGSAAVSGGGSAKRPRGQRIPREGAALDATKGAASIGAGSGAEPGAAAPAEAAVAEPSHEGRREQDSRAGPAPDAGSAGGPEEQPRPRQEHSSERPSSPAAASSLGQGVADSGAGAADDARAGAAPPAPAQAAPAPAGAGAGEKAGAQQRQRSSAPRILIDPTRGGLQVPPPSAAPRPAGGAEAMPPPAAVPKKKVYGAARPPPGWKPEDAQQPVVED